MPTQPKYMCRTFRLKTLASAALLWLTVASPASAETMASLLTHCPASPNCVCSLDSSAQHRIAPLTPTGSLNEAWRGLADYLVRQKRTKIVTQNDHYIAAEVRTRLMRFVDDVEFELDQAEGVIAMRSASRLGFSDLGTNRRRLERLRSALVEAGLVLPR